MDEIPCPAGKLAFPGISPSPPRMSPGSIENEGASTPFKLPRNWGDGRFAAEGGGPPDLPGIGLLRRCAKNPAADERVRSGRGIFIYSYLCISITSVSPVFMETSMNVSLPGKVSPVKTSVSLALKGMLMRLIPSDAA